MKHNVLPVIGLRTALHGTVLIGVLLFAGDVVSRAQTTSHWPDQIDAGAYQIFADFEISKMPEVVNELVNLEKDLTEILKIGHPREQIKLYLFRNKRSYQKYVSKYFPGIPTRQALYIKRTGPGLVFAYLGKDFLVDLRHEATHALLHANLPVVPLWLDEGIAEYFEVIPQRRVYGHSHLNAVKWKNRLGRLRDVKELESISNISQMRKSEYIEVWAWVHFMLHGDSSARRELLAFLEDIGNMNPPGQLSSRLKSRVENLYEKYRAHVRTWPS